MAYTVGQKVLIKTPDEMFGKTGTVKAVYKGYCAVSSLARIRVILDKYLAPANIGFDWMQEKI